MRQFAGYPSWYNERRKKDKAVLREKGMDDDEAAGKGKKAD